jgi:hypothetical protein
MFASILAACTTADNGQILSSSVNQAVQQAPTSLAQPQSTPVAQQQSTPAQSEPIDLANAQPAQQPVNSQVAQNPGNIQPVQVAENPQSVPVNEGSVQQAPLQTAPNPVRLASASTQERSGARLGTATSSFASDQQTIFQPIRPRTRKTYLINGLASNIGNIGYGFTNLSKKIPGSILHNYASFIESSTVIRSKVTRELKAAYKADPKVEINLIGISFGANIVTIIAQELGRSNIPVNYLATLDGPAMIPIRDNVRVTDNFTCSNLDCFRTTSRLSWGNKKTVHRAYKLKTSHIPLANHATVHSRILAQIRANPDQQLALQ